jgi:hypothetical protein
LIWVISWFTPSLSFQRGATPVVVTVVGTLLLAGHVYSSTPVWSALLLAIAPMGAWVGRIGPARRLRPWLSVVIGLIAVVAFVAGAIGLALVVSPPFGES